jgi:hypothetical protein
MRNGLIGLVSAMVLVSTMATAGCSGSDSSEGTGGTGGSASNTGGSASNTGGSASNTGGSASNTGGSASNTGGSADCTGGASGEPVTTLSGCKVLNALTSEEFTQLCNETYAYFGSGITPATICKWKGVLFATQSSAPTEEKLRQNCTSKESPCLDDPGATWASPSCSEFPEDCTATVADYATCIRDEAAALTQSVSGLPGCDTFTSDYWTPVWDIVGADQPESCTFCAGLYPPDPRQF